MFVKIIKWIPKEPPTEPKEETVIPQQVPKPVIPKSGEEVVMTQMVECDKWTFKPDLDRIDTGVMELEMNMAGAEGWSNTTTWYISGHMQVFILNSEGKTIDRIYG